MGNTWFQFQQFRVHQDRCAMKISTDAVLLGTLAGKESPESILDIGTGTGVVALMLAQRFPKASVTAIEIDADAAEQAGENFRESPFSDRLSLVQGRVQDFASGEKFDLIASNPPFFPDHLKSSDAKRNRALHTDELSFWELVEKVSHLLAPSGTFWVILPPRQMRDLGIHANQFGLTPFHSSQVQDRADKAVYREIVGFSFHRKEEAENTVILKNADNSYTGSYSALLSGFLLGY